MARASIAWLVLPAAACSSSSEHVALEHVVGVTAFATTIVARHVELDAMSNIVRSERALLRLEESDVACENLPVAANEAPMVRLVDGETPVMVVQEPSVGGPTGFGRLGNVTLYERTPAGWQSRSTILHEELLGAFRADDGALVVVTTLAFRRIVDLADPGPGTPLAVPCVDDARCRFVPTGNDGGVLSSQLEAQVSVGPLRCDDAGCIHDATLVPMASGSATELLVLATGDPVLLSLVAGPSPAKTDQMLATFLDGHTETLAEAKLAATHLAPRTGGGLALVYASFEEGEPLVLVLRDGDGALRAVDIASADFEEARGGLAVVAGGEGDAEVVRVFRGFATQIQEIRFVPATNETTVRMFDVCRGPG